MTNTKSTNPEVNRIADDVMTHIVIENGEDRPRSFEELVTDLTDDGNQSLSEGIAHEVADEVQRRGGKNFAYALRAAADNSDTQ